MILKLFGKAELSNMSLDSTLLLTSKLSLLQFLLTKPFVSEVLLKTCLGCCISGGYCRLLCLQAPLMHNFKQCWELTVSTRPGYIRLKFILQDLLKKLWAHSCKSQKKKHEEDNCRKKLSGDGLTSASTNLN